MTLDPIRWRRLERLFEAALERSSETRSAFLSEQCGSDFELLAELQAMLDSHEDDRQLAIEARLIEAPVEEQRVGQYRLIEPIGQGGMGEVFLAERADAQYRQQVAIKLLRPGFYGREMISRFERERQILARLEHPNIATLLDGGVADDGRPYLVMQRVRGEPITEYCDRRRLTIEDRLRLFITACRTVQFSHANMVVHRDLKPSNILVTDDGELKLLDFGIAKLLETQGVEADMTRAEHRVMTPERAAPEQLRGEPVTAAVDVYGLGFLLCELLSGRAPYRFPSRDALEIARVVDSGGPMSPSRLLRRGSNSEEPSSEPTTEVLAAQRCCRPERLRGLLSGDLDRIVLMALRREPERRYVSAAQLGDDVERYLTGEPVIAHGDSRSYRVRKFLERHRWGVAVASLFVLLILGFGIVTAFQSQQVADERDRANAERDRAEAVVQLLTGLFETADPVKDPGRDQISVTELLERGELRLADLEDQPETQARMLLVLGKINTQRTRFAKARELLERARELYGKAQSEPDGTSLEIDHQLALAIKRLGDFDAARRALTETLAGHRRAYGTRHEKTAEVMIHLASISPLDERGLLLSEALAVRRELFDPRDPAIASSLDALASYHRRLENYETARRLYREAFAIVAAALGEKHPHAITVLSNLSGVLENPDEKIRTLQRVLELRQDILPGSVESAIAWNNLGVAQMKADRGVEARRALAASLDLFVEHLGADHWQVGNTTISLGAIDELEGNYSEALAHYERAHELIHAARGADHIATGVLVGKRAQVLAKLGRYEEALRGARESVRVARLGSPARRNLATSLLRLGWVALISRASIEAEAALLEALEIGEDFFGSEHPWYRLARAGLDGAQVVMNDDGVVSSLPTLEITPEEWQGAGLFELRLLWATLRPSQSNDWPSR